MGNLIGPGTRQMVLETMVAMDRVEAATLRGGWALDRRRDDHWVQIGTFGSKADVIAHLRAMADQGADESTLRVRRLARITER